MKIIRFLNRRRAVWIAGGIGAFILATGLWFWGPSRAAGRWLRAKLSAVVAPQSSSPSPAKALAGASSPQDGHGAGHAPPLADRGPVEISPAQEQLIGLETARAEYRTLEKIIRTVGRVDIDETRVARIHTRVNGWIQKVFVDQTYKHVQKGDPLFTIYSPELVATQQEYLLALKGQRDLAASSFAEVAAGADSLLAATRQRLLLWDVSPDQINELERTGEIKREIVLYSPITGHVVERKAFPNQYVTPEMEVYSIVDHSRVWVYADIYESEIGFVRVGQYASVTVDAYPGEVFRGKITYLWPHLDMQTRTLKARMEFPNRNLKLKPEMYAHVELKIPRGRRLVVPDSAVIDTGTKEMVFVEKTPGRFEPRDVKLGHRVEGFVEILNGLKAGESVAASATFLIDSESQLRAALSGLSLGTGVTEIGGRRAVSGGGAEAAGLRIEFQTQPDPPRAGMNEARVTVRDATGRPVEAARVRVALFMPAMPSMGMPAMRSEAVLAPVGAGEYRGEINIEMSGTWQVRVEIEKDGTVIGTKQSTLTAR